MGKKDKKYDLRVEQTGSEKIPIKLTIPIKYLQENSDLINSYGSDESTSSLFLISKEEELKNKYGIEFPKRFNWLNFVNENILPKTKIIGYCAAGLDSFLIKDDNLIIGCMLTDPNWR